MTNTIPNVPRELTIERDVFGAMHIKLGDFDFIQIQYQYPYTDNASTKALAERIAALLSAPSPADHVEDVRAMVADPSPAGVDGLDAIGYVSQDDIKWQGDCTLRLKPYSDYVTPLCRLSDAQAIIDGLRGEVAKINSDRLACWAEFKVMTRACLDAEKERDQHAQRIGELEGLLYEASGELRTDRHHGLRPRIDAALSAGKDSGQ